MMLKILRLLFVAIIELFNNNGRLAPVKNKTTTEARKAYNGQYQAVLDTVHVTVFGQSNVVSAEAMADTFFVAS